MGVQYDSTESGVCHRNIHAGNFPDLLLAAKHQDMLILFSQHCLKVDLFKKRKKEKSAGSNCICLYSSKTLRLKNTLFAVSVSLLTQKAKIL